MDNTFLPNNKMLLYGLIIVISVVNMNVATVVLIALDVLGRSIN